MDNDADTCDALVVALERRLDAVEQSVSAMSAAVRTQRLVVVDEQGNERIVAEVVDGHAELRVVLAGREPGRSSMVAIFAADRPPRDEGRSVGLQLWAAGDAVFDVSAWEGADRRWTTDMHVERWRDQA